MAGALQRSRDRVQLRPHLIRVSGRQRVGRYLECPDERLKLRGRRGQHRARICARLAFPVGRKPAQERLALLSRQRVEQPRWYWFVGAKRAEHVFAPTASTRLRCGWFYA